MLAAPGTPLRHATALGKFAHPRLGRVFGRQRLFKQLDAFAECAGIWIAAPPGAGKTTLVATWIQQRADPTLWLQLDREDADPATFAQSLDGVLGTLLAKPAALPPLAAEDLADEGGWLHRRLRYLLPYLPPRWTLVLDNCQALATAAPLNAALGALLAGLPAGVQWVFVSRQTPPPPFARALAGQQLAVLYADSLVLDDDETMALVRLHGRPDAMAGALAAAQGWAAGMTLMLMGSPARAQVPAPYAQQRLFDYFADEVFAQLPVAEQRALCRLAYLPSTSAGMAVEMSGEPSVPAWLERLAAASLFTDRRDGSPPVFVFHALFSEFLRRRFQRHAAASEVAALQRQAGLLLRRAGQADAGLQSLLDAQAWPEAEDCIRQDAPRHVIEGRTLALRWHIDALPAASAERLALWRGVSTLDTDPVAGLADLTAAHRNFAAAGDIDGQLLAAAAAATALVALGRFGELDTWIDVLDAHADRAQQPVEPEIEALLVPGLLAALVFRRPWHPLAQALALRGERLMHREEAVGHRLLLGALVLHFQWRGNMEQLERLLLRIDALCAQGLAAPSTLLRWWEIGILVKCQLGQHDAARADVGQALALVARQMEGAHTAAALAPQRARVEMLAVFLALAEADAAGARRHLDRAALTLDPDGATDRTLYELERGMLVLLEGDGPAAMRLMQAAVGTGQRSGYAVREHIALIGHALAAAVNGAHEVAAQQMQAAMAHPVWSVCIWHRWVGGCVAAYAALRCGDSGQAAVALQSAFGAARQFGFRHSPMLRCCTDLLPQLAAFALRHGIEAETARDIVNRHRLAAPPTADSAWPWPVRIRAFGPLQVQVDGAPLPSSRKESRRLLELLRLLAAHSHAPVMQDRIADALWPDANGDAARNALDNLLHRLRKALGGDDRIVLRQGALALDPSHCWIDVRALDDVLGQLEGAPVAALPALLSQARDLYREPLLPDDPLPTVAARRDALHARVTHAMQSAVARLRGDGQTLAVPSMPKPAL